MLLSNTVNQNRILWNSLRRLWSVGEFPCGISGLIYKVTSSASCANCTFAQSLVWQAPRFSQLPTYWLFQSFICSLTGSLTSLICLFGFVIHLFFQLMFAKSLTYSFAQSEIHSSPISPLVSALAHSFHAHACSRTHFLDHLFACSVNSFADMFEKNAERSPLECREFDSWTPSTSRLPQRPDCMKQWARNPNMVVHSWHPVQQLEKKKNSPTYLLLPDFPHYWKSPII